MGNIYLNKEVSQFLRPTLNRITPYSTALHEMLAREAIRNPEGQTGLDAREFLRQKGYLDPRIIDEMIYLGLPRDVSNALLEASSPPWIENVAIPPKDDWPTVFVAVPR